MLCPEGKVSWNALELSSDGSTGGWGGWEGVGEDQGSHATPVQAYASSWC